jgi:DNA-binding CsgD family transcriptional regulator
MDAEAAIPKEDQAYQLHCRGMTYRQIARELGIDKDTVTRYVRAIQRELAPLHRRNVKRWTNEAVERLAEVQRAAWKQFEATGDIGALNTVANCEERIARLRGLFEADSAAPGGTSINVVFVNDWRRGSDG